ncbi:MAG: tripartite tricarboxylate transporter permease [Acidiferrobacteraceae bacterium]|nr:tripartite tricarboxylate transporter permease [Acidiferrobacteraceae bacterium]MBT3972946.1 tripartite tricarboxylate transporter permease [Acidiferrobacteraceae bacterium]MBT5979621.1 tripartite tricarboxylate transporter permease [Acidiferrobacteraceae bacterium]MBT6787057.1 tripartite tricarboxylate transporter permease [Acidiferrobacteraceae bacterium]
MQGFSIALEPLNLALVIFGCALGLFIGAMPGLGSVNGVAILLPMTFLVPPTGAIIFLAAIYYGAMYGGAISSIMLGIPGASTAVATTFDGRPLALAGKADQALITAAGASFIGGTISVVLFTLFAPPLAEVALAFGAAEEFALMMLAFATFIGLGGDDIPKTLFSIFIGLVLSAVGLDIISGEPRLIFGDLPGFFHGINFLVLAIGIYGIGEMLWTIESSHGGVKVSQASFSIRRIATHLKGLKHSLKASLMGSFLGYFVGILPAAGATPGSIMAYGMAKTMSKDPDSFGKGNIEGVAAPESANNAASTGSMLPMLTLGIPGSPTTAILLGGMVIWGLEPGPMLFVEHQSFVWGLIASLYVANLFAMLINLAFIPAFIGVLRMPFTILAPIIFVLCLVGGYAPTQNMHDVWLILIFGIVGYLMRKLDYPLAPAVLAIVLGPLAETSMRQALLMSDGNLMIFIERPISGPIMGSAVVLFLLPLLKLFRKSRVPASD